MDNLDWIELCKRRDDKCTVGLIQGAQKQVNMCFDKWAQFWRVTFRPKGKLLWCDFTLHLLKSRSFPNSPWSEDIQGLQKQNLSSDKVELPTCMMSSDDALG